MVEYSLAKAEVEGSSPFFRLGFYSLSFLLQNSIFFFCRLVLSSFLAKANLRKKFFFFIAPREKLRSVALLEFSLESNSDLWIMQLLLLYYAELIKI